MLIVIPFTPAQAEEAERLCDFIFFLSGKQQFGSCLLIAGSDVHEEFKIKVKLAAEVAFENVELVSSDDGNLFGAAIKTVNENYKSPWLWLEPDCVPMKIGWLDALQTAYESQSKKILGAHLKNTEGQILLARQSVYPPDMTAEFDRVLASTKCRLIQQGKFTTREDIRPDTVLFCADKSGELIKSLREE